MLLKRKLLTFTALVTLFLSVQFAHAIEPIDTQLGQDGMSVHLVKLKVNNGVLTGSFMYDNDSGGAVKLLRPNLNEIHYVAGSKKYPVLKDANGDWLAAPVHDEDFILVDNYNGSFMLAKDAKAVVWFKFPSPPEGTDSIEISIPGVSPFSADLAQP